MTIHQKIKQFLNEFKQLSLEKKDSLPLVLKEFLESEPFTDWIFLQFFKAQKALFFKYFINFSQQFSNEIRFLVPAEKVGLLTGPKAQENHDHLMLHVQLKDVSRALEELDDVGLLTHEETTQAYFNGLLAHPNPWDVARTIKEIHRETLLIDEALHANYLTIIENTHTEPEDIANALRITHDVNIREQEHIHALLKHARPLQFARILVLLNLNNVPISTIVRINSGLTQEYPHLEHLVDMLEILHSTHLLTQQYLNERLNYQLEVILDALKMLHERHLLTKESLDAIFNNIRAKPTDLAYVFITFPSRVITSTTAQINYKAVLNHARPKHIINTLRLVDSANQDNLNELMDNPELGNLINALNIIDREDVSLLDNEVVKANLLLILTHPKFRDVLRGLRLLNQNNCLTQINFDTFLKREVNEVNDIDDMRETVEVIRQLHYYGLRHRQVNLTVPLAPLALALKDLHAPHQQCYRYGTTGANF